MRIKNRFGQAGVGALRTYIQGFNLAKESEMLSVLSEVFGQPVKTDGNAAHKPGDATGRAGRKGEASSRAGEASEAAGGGCRVPS